VEYKTLAEARARLEKNKKMLQKKQYHDKLGPDGYRTTAPKWEQAEATMIEQGITPAIVDWPIRSKHWFYMHGGMLHPATWHIMGPTDEAFTKIITKVAKAREGNFNPNR
jgi:hypothetical protein